MNKKTKIIGVMNNKGGVLKTTIATNLASLLAKHGNKVLLIDLDAQANVSLSFGINPDRYQLSIADVLLNHCNLNKVTQFEIIKNIDLCPASIKLNQFIDTFPNHQDNYYILRDLLKSVINKYDYIIIDSSPYLNLLTQNIITASDEILVPVQMEVLAARGLLNLVDEIRQYKGKIKAIIPTLFDTRTNIHSDILKQITKIAEDINVYVTKTKITKSIKAANANAYHRVPLVLTNIKGKWVEQYTNLASELDYIPKGTNHA